MKRIIIGILFVSSSMLFAVSLKDIKTPAKNQEELTYYSDIIADYGIPIYQEYNKKLFDLKKISTNLTEFKQKAIQLTNAYFQKIYPIHRAIDTLYGNNVFAIKSIKYDKMLDLINDTQKLLYWVNNQWTWEKSDPDPIDDSFYYLFESISEVDRARIVLKISNNELSMWLTCYEIDMYLKLSTYTVFTRFGTEQALEDVWELNQDKKFLFSNPFYYLKKMLKNDKFVFRIITEDDAYTYLFNINGLMKVLIEHSNDYPDLLKQIK
ncbi:MAG: hypothetical protein HPY53_15925 [Brevinematales bacterium]|nr:hypothetical protein [Brevinematales bacterium]